jgi:protein-S-isoprenylcysteine O-methyltransferase Ste14
MSKLELKVPPVVVWVVIAVLMWAGARAVPSLGIAWPRRQGIATVMAAAGAVVAILGVVAFRRAKTTVNPLHPEKMSALVSGGIYRTTRNPMYLGMLIILAGWAVWLGNLLPCLFLPGFIAYMNRFQIVPEERMLTAMFGNEFAAYRARVRRWI